MAPWLPMNRVFRDPATRNSAYSGLTCGEGTEGARAPQKTGKWFQEHLCLLLTTASTCTLLQKDLECVSPLEQLPGSLNRSTWALLTALKGNWISAKKIRTQSWRGHALLPGCLLHDVVAPLNSFLLDCLPFFSVILHGILSSFVLHNPTFREWRPNFFKKSDLESACVI